MKKLIFGLIAATIATTSAMADGVRYEKDWTDGLKINGKTYKEVNDFGLDKRKRFIHHTSSEGNKFRMTYYEGDASHIVSFDVKPNDKGPWLRLDGNPKNRRHVVFEQGYKAEMAKDVTKYLAVLYDKTVEKTKDFDLKACRWNNWEAVSNKGNVRHIPTRTIIVPTKDRMQGSYIFEYNLNRYLTDEKYAKRFLHDVAWNACKQSVGGLVG